jgi:hypothetical protein
MLIEKKLLFHNLDRIPFKFYLKGHWISGTITPIGEMLSDGMPSVFQLRIPQSRMVTISNENGIWKMPADEDFVIELGVWIELYYQ